MRNGTNDEDRAFRAKWTAKSPDDEGHLNYKVHLNKANSTLPILQATRSFILALIYMFKVIAGQKVNGA